MEKARTADGTLVVAKNGADYRGEPLSCADDKCGAPMIFREGGLVGGSLTYRAACFASKDKKAHVATCTAYEDLAIKSGRRKSIEEGLARENTVILLNLNIRLADAFNGAVRSGGITERSTREVGDYVAVPVKSIEDLLDYKAHIEKLAGSEGLARTRVNYRGKTTPIADFIVDSTEKYAALVQKMRDDLAKNPAATAATGFPRLITFKSVPARGALKGSPVTLMQDNGKQLVLLQDAEAQKGLRRVLRGSEVLMIAAPRLERGEADRAFGALANGSDKVVFLDIHWKVVGANQFMLPSVPDVPQQNTLKF